MKYYTLLLAAATLLAVGCGTEASETTGPIPTSSAKQASPSTQLPMDTNALKAAQISTVPQQSSSIPQQAVPGNSNIALNPPHGQPGHRCDIEVGKPLNSAPAQPNISTQPQQINPQPQQINTLPQPANPSSTAGVNPPHGQPGHRCDIAVGAPLK